MASASTLNILNTSILQEQRDVKPKVKKYGMALKTIIPYRKPKESNTLPSNTSGLFSFVTLSWLSGLMWKALKNNLTKEDLWDLNPVDMAEVNAIRLSRLWREEVELKGMESASFAKVVWRFGKTRFLVASLLMSISVFFQFIGPAWILKGLVNFIEDKTQPIEIGITFLLLSFAAQLLKSLTFSALWLVGVHTAIRLEGAMQYLTFHKLLRLRNGGDKTLSQAITFCTNDQERIFDSVCGGVFLIAVPFAFLFTLIYTCVVLGPWALLGNLVILIFYPVMGAIGRSIAAARRKTVKHTNVRVGFMNEILNSIRLIKMYAWEVCFSAKIKEIRTSEIKQLRIAAFLQSLTATIAPMISIIATTITFIGFTLSGNSLTPSIAFSVFSVFTTLNMTIGSFPWVLRSITETLVSFSNFKKYIELPEYELSNNDPIECDHNSVIVIRNATFAWESNTVKKEVEKRSHKKGKKDKKGKMNGDVNETRGLTIGPKYTNYFENLTVEVKRGKLIGVCGQVGSGKSSLISAILGDMKKMEGNVLIRGSIACVAQQAWIYAATFKENILFGLPENETKYNEVLDICCLKPDIARLPNQDMTIIGERGVNLSGGQKQRLNLARSLYSDKSIYLLDDPLSSVDSLLSDLIFERTIFGELKGKTIILVSNSFKFLEKCDEIYFIRDGTITEQGTYDKLLKSKGEFYNLAKFDQKRGSTGDVHEEEMTEAEKNVTKSNNDENVVIFKTEETEFGDRSLKAFGLYLKACGGYFPFIVVLISIFLFAFSRLFTSVWIQRWLDAGDGNSNRTGNWTIDETEANKLGSITDNPNLEFYQFVLGLSVIVSIIIGLLKGLMVVGFVLRGASRLHNQMFDRILTTKLSFFDSTPGGVIINRFSKDMDEIDARLPFFFEFVFQALIFVFSSILVICMVFPIISFPLIVILVLMILLDIWLNVGVRQAKKLENMLKAPVIHHIKSSMAGLSTIRTYHREGIFISRFTGHLNKHLAAEAIFRFASRWFSVRMDVMGVITIFVTALVSIIMRNEISSAYAGLALSSVYLMSTFVPFVMRMKSELQARFNSVERILDYAQNLEQEEQAAVCIKKPSDWPLMGEIEMRSVSFRYREDLPKVLKEVTLHVRGGAKVGIVGRTGAGKTSLLMPLLKLYPLETGQILIDNIDIALMTLQDLRSEISVIPQDPVLFHETLRYNLDPFKDYKDSEIWAALERVQLKSKIIKQDKRLETIVRTDTDNFSMGEKQLICLARALLRRHKILFLDEATGSMDVETDYLIQKTIREAFHDCTVITVAHRLNTVATYDRIAVMDSGRVIEYDTPANLMKNESSQFYKLMKAAGISSLDTQGGEPGEKTDEVKN